MDPFTQRMLERAKARREKLEAKLPPSEQNKRQRLPLIENNQTVEIPKSPRSSPATPTKIEKTYSVSQPLIFNGEDENDVAVKINIVHQNNIQVEVQVEEREITLSEYLKEKENDSNFLEIQKANKENKGVTMGANSHQISDKSSDMDKTDTRSEIRDACKSRLQKLGKFYSDGGRLSSPIHQSRDLNLERIEPVEVATKDVANEDMTKNDQPTRVKKFGRLAALADHINNWEDDTSHHDFKDKKPEPSKPAFKNVAKIEPTAITKPKDNSSNVKPAISAKVAAACNKLTEQPKSNNVTANKVTSAVSNSIFKKLDSPKVEPPTSKPQSSTPSKTVSAGNSTPVKKKPEVAASSPVSAVKFQPHIVASSPKKSSPKQAWDKKILDNLERQGFSRARAGNGDADADAGAGADTSGNRKGYGNAKDMAACAPIKRPPPPPPPTLALTIAPLPAPENQDEESQLPLGLRRDPAHMSVREKKAMFERRPASDDVKKFPVTNFKPKIETNCIPVPVHAPMHQKTADKVSNVITNNNKVTLSEQDISDKVKKEREDDMKVIFRRFQTPDFDKIEQDNRDDDGSSEISPLMGNAAVKSSTTSLNAKKPAIFNPPKTILAQSDDQISSTTDKTDAIVNNQPKKRCSIDSPLVVSALDNVKKIKVAPPRPGGIYPHLSDVEGQTSEEEKQSCPASLDTSSDSAYNEKADDFCNTSFGREVMQAVGVKKTPEISQKLSAKKTKGKSDRKRYMSNDSSDSSFNNENLDDFLDEAFDYDDNGPTPPKQNKNGTQPSNSFHYKKGSEIDVRPQADVFKSPLKIPGNSNRCPDKANEAVKPLVHTVSFYRRSQLQGSQPSTPVRIVHMESIDNNDETSEQAARQAQITAHESRRRVKELLEEVTKQNAVISQASQALNLCASTIEFSGSTEQAEGERLLLIATHRRQACLHEVQRVQVEGVGSHKGHSCTLNIEEIAVPLKREYIRQINADGAVGHYLVCLIKCQERIMATSLVKTSPDSFTVAFPDKFRLEGLDSDFKVTVETYSLQASKEILPHDIKYHIATKKSGKLATPRKGARGADLKSPLPMSSPGGPAAVRTPTMQPQGYCIFSYQQISRNNFTLSKAGGCSPLEGCLRVKLTCERQAGQVSSTRVHRGFLTMFEDAGGFGAWHRRWCVLHSGDLSYWRYPDDEKKKTPMGSIELSTATSEAVGPAPRDLCARPHTLLLETSSSFENVEGESARSLIIANGKRRHLLAADTKPERDAWAKAFNETLTELKDAMNT
ncbi:anillin, actin binding protein isoform X2 [Arctopsyche grandis]|uniref:anillin, actin binding protein isoform X2 n=1 Tax=Arctopsyche grandis TaxID=121162 RepID=UPI00406D985E